MRYPFRPLRTGAVLISALLLAGCGVLSPGEDGRHINVGTTSAPSTLDPAAAWDSSWELYRNVFQTLMHFPGTSSVPEPDAASSCSFTNAGSRTYRCELRDGLKFSNGNSLDAAAVKHSLDRVRKIGAQTGPAALLDSLESVEVTGDTRVTFHLKRPDATFPFILTTPATALVDPAEYPADELIADDDKLVGSGPYTLAEYRQGEKAELKENPEYTGGAELRNDSVTIRYFDASGAMADALRKDEIDLTYRGLAPDQITEFQEGAAADAGIGLTKVVMPEIRYLVFNPAHKGADSLAVRRAIAQLIDRDTLVRRVYQGTAEKLYSMVPRGIAGHNTAFFDRYGEPDQKRARKTLTAAGIKDPVELTLWYTTDRYGSVTGKEFKEIERQLESSGLFDITVKGMKWAKYDAAYKDGKFAVFGRGWSPDFPDPDNYIAPFVGKQNALGTPYESPRITDELLPRSRRESDRAGVNQHFTQAQDILAEDARLLPLWQARQYIASHEDIAGMEWSLDPSTIMRVWELYKKTDW